MKKYFSAFLLLVVFLGLSGCSARPQAINGKYYMGGDDSCRGYRIIGDSRIMCIDSNGKETGYRDAMSQQDMNMYTMQKQAEANKQASDNAFYQNLNKKYQMDQQNFELNRMNNYLRYGY